MQERVISLFMAGTYGVAPPAVIAPCNVCTLTMVGEQGFACLLCAKQCHGRCGYEMRHCPWCYSAIIDEKKNRGKWWLKCVGWFFLFWFVVQMLHSLKRLFIKHT